MDSSSKCKIQGSYLCIFCEESRCSLDYRLGHAVPGNHQALSGQASQKVVKRNVNLMSDVKSPFLHELSDHDRILLVSSEDLQGIRNGPG